jgi:hypothetical protein
LTRRTGVVIASCTCNKEPWLEGSDPMIKTRAAGEVAAMVPSRLCCRATEGMPAMRMPVRHRMR